MKIPYCKPAMTQEMIDAAVDSLKNEYTVGGESIKKFEEEFAKYIGTQYAVAVGSGTNALFLSLLALGLKNDDKVLTSAFSFIASANPVIHANGLPIFSDIDESTGLINPDLLKEKIDKKIAGVIPVHLYGNVCDMEKINELKKEGLFVIEDACQAHGAEYKGKKAGSIGDVGCFSFYSTKNMTVAGDGGMVTTDNEEIAEKIKKLRDYGRKSQYEHVLLGYSSRLNTVNAAIGRVQLKHLDEWNEARRRIAMIYQQNLPEEMLLKENGKSVYHVFGIKVKERDKVREHLAKNEITTAIHYPIPIHLQPIYRELFNYKEGDFPVAEKFAKEILSLPIFPDMKKDEVEFVCEKLLEVIK